MAPRRVTKSSSHISVRTICCCRAGWYSSGFRSYSFVVSLNTEHPEHTWQEITSNGMFTSHNSKGDSLYGADISTHPKHRHEGIGGMLYDARKQLVIKLNLRRMIAGGRLFNYCEHVEKMSALEYAQKVIKGDLRDPVLSFELDNGFRFIKILPNYLNDVRSLNYASFIEWLNPRHHQFMMDYDTERRF